MPPRKKLKRNISGLRNQPPRQLPPVLDETNINSAGCGGISGLSGIEEAGSGTQHSDLSPDSKTPEAPSPTSSSSCQIEDAKEEECDNFQASKTENLEELEFDPSDAPPHSQGNKRRKNTYREENRFTYLVMRKRTNNPRAHVPSSDDDEFKPGRKQKTTVAVKTPRRSMYKKGPDVASKSDRTQNRYRDLLKDQTSLDGFGFKVA